MSRKPGSIPAYSLHRASGQGIVRLCGRDCYLGPYGSSESCEKYDRLIAEWVANGRQPTETPQTADSVIRVLGMAPAQKSHLEFLEFNA